MDEQKRRPKGDGSIYWIPNSPFAQMKVVIDGKVFKKSSKKTTDNEAYAVLQSWRSKLQAGTLTETEEKGGGAKVNDLWDAVKNDYVRREHKSLDGTEQRWNRNLKPFFGHMRAAKVTNQHIEAYIRKRFEDPSRRGQVKGATIGRELGLLRRCFKLGMRGNPPKVRVMPYIPQFKDHKRTGFLKFDMHDTIVEACRAETPLGELWLEAIFESAYTFGWRHGMITPLLVEQVHIVSPAEGYLIIPDSKNGEPVEVPLHLNERLIPLYLELIRGKKPGDLVFTRGANQRPVMRFDKLWRKVCRRAGVTGKLLLHDMRRTAAKRMAKSGMRKEVIKRICGWITDSMFQRYNIVENSDVASDAGKLKALDERERQGARELVKLEGMRKSGQVREYAGKNRYNIGTTPRKVQHRTASKDSPSGIPKSNLVKELTGTVR